MTARSDLRLAIDIGGTFTDSVVADGNTILCSTKTLTTHGNPSVGALAGVDGLLETANVSMIDLDGLVHGTTLATNALIERRGANVATVTTGGFRDILEIAYERRYAQYDIGIEKPDLIVPRRQAFTITERVSVRGEVIAPLDLASVPRLVDDLDTCGAEAIAICLLHSYANPDHEERLRDQIHALRPDIAVSISSEVSPEAREFDRLCTTIANAYIQPMMAGYLSEFAAAFSERGLRCPILMMTASGGMTTLETAARFPIRLVESGPAGGAILAARIARQCDERQALSFDMGGTTAKLCLIDGYTPQTSRRFEIARAARFMKGSGMPVRIPVVEMVEIGAGGGSVAAVDRLGRLTVGPMSAGSEPGPIAFGRGGQNATVTDADVALGLIDPEMFAEGRLKVDRDAAEQGLADQIGERLQLDAWEAAGGVSEIVDEHMAAAARMHAVESGKDLGGRAMIAFGGNGPLHATRVARRSGVSRVIVPLQPGVGSAVGFLFAPVSFEIVRSHYQVLDSFDARAVRELFLHLEAEAETVVRAGAPTGSLTCRRTAFMRYRGQGHEVEIDVPDMRFDQAALDALRIAFEDEYSRQFSRPVPGMTVEILNWCLRLGTSPARPASVSGSEDSRCPPPRQYRTIRCDVTDTWVDAGLFWRPDLTPGDKVSGPALIVEPQTTTFVSGDFDALVDGAGNVHLFKRETLP